MTSDLNFGALPPAELRAAVLAQAAALADTLPARAAEMEALRRLPDDLADELARRGLLRLLTPASIGGLEVPMAVFFEAIERIARGDASTAWCTFISCTASVLAAYLPKDVSAQAFGSPTARAAGVFAPRGRAVAAVQDGVAGYRIDGRWFWGSAAHHAQVVSGGCLVIGTDGRPEALPDGTPRVLSVLFDRAQVRLLDNWSSVGLCGTGSGEFEVSGAFVPAARCASLMGAARETGPLYRFPVFGLLALSISAVASGVARQAIDELIHLAGGKVPQGSARPLAQRAGTQEAVARAEAQWRAARALVREAIDAAWDAAVDASNACQASGTAGDAGGTAGSDSGTTADPGRLPVALRADLRLAATHMVHTAAGVVDRMFTLAGGDAIFAASPLQRALRDIHVATQHMMVAEPTFELVGRLHLGLPTQVSML